MESSIETSQTGGTSYAKPALAPKPRLTPKPFSLQKNSTIRSINAPKAVTATSKSPANQTQKSDATGVPTPPLTTTAQKPHQQSTPSDSKPSPVHAKDKPKTTKESKAKPHKEETPDSIVAPGKSVPASQTTPPKSVPIQKEDVYQTNQKPSVNIITNSDQTDGKQKVDESCVIQKPEESGSDSPSTADPIYRWGSTRKRLPSELTSRFESGGLPVPPQPTTTISTTSTKDDVNKSASSGPQQSQTTSESSNRDSNEGQPVECYSTGGSIKHRISQLFDSSSASESMTEKEEPEVITGIGGVNKPVSSDPDQSQRASKPSNKENDEGQTLKSYSRGGSIKRRISQLSDSSSRSETMTKKDEPVISGTGGVNKPLSSDAEQSQTASEPSNRESKEGGMMELSSTGGSTKGRTSQLSDSSSTSEFMTNKEEPEVITDTGGVNKPAFCDPDQSQTASKPSNRENDEGQPLESYSRGGSIKRRISQLFGSSSRSEIVTKKDEPVKSGTGGVNKPLSTDTEQSQTASEPLNRESKEGGMMELSSTGGSTKGRTSQLSDSSSTSEIMTNRDEPELITDTGGVNKPASSDQDQSQTASKLSNGENDEGQPLESYSRGGSIKRRISQLFGSSSRSETMTKKDEPEVISGTGGVKERIKQWAAETNSEAPNTEKQPQVVPRTRSSSFEQAASPTVEKTPKMPPVELPATGTLSAQAVEPSLKVSTGKQLIESPVETAKDAVEKPLESSTETPREYEQNKSSEVRLHTHSPSAGQTAADEGESASSAPKRDNSKRRSVRFGIVERDDGGPPMILGSVSESSSDEEEATEDEGEVETAVLGLVNRREGILRNKDNVQKQEEEWQKHLEAEKRLRAEESEQERVKLEQERKQEEEEKEKEKARQREEIRLREEAKRREEERERERQRERLKQQEIDRQSELMWQREREEEIERARQMERERLMEEERERRRKEELQREKLKEEERERERLRQQEIERQAELMRQRQREEERERARQMEERLRQEEREKLMEEERERRRQEELQREKLKEEEREMERLRQQEIERQSELMWQRQREEDRERARQMEERLRQEERERQRLREEDRERARQMEERLRQEERERQRLREEAEERERERQRRLEEEERMRERQGQEEERTRRELERRMQQKKEEEMEKMRQIEKQREEERREEEWRRQIENERAEELGEKMREELERKRAKEMEEKLRMDEERNKKEGAVHETKSNLISFDSDDVHQKSETPNSSLAKTYRPTESNIEVNYDDFSVRKPLIEVDFEDFSVKPKRWGSQAKVEPHPVQTRAADPVSKEAREVLLPLNVHPRENKVPEQVVRPYRPEPTTAMESPDEEEEEEEVRERSEEFISMLEEEEDKETESEDDMDTVEDETDDEDKHEPDHRPHFLTHPKKDKLHFLWCCVNHLTMQFLGGKLLAAQLQVAGWVDSVRQSLQGALELVWDSAEEKQEEGDVDKEGEEEGGDGQGRFQRAMSPLRSFARRSRRSLRRFSLRSRQTLQRRTTETCSAQINSYCINGDDKDTDALIDSEPDLQNGGYEETSDTDSPNLVPAPDFPSQDIDSAESQREQELAPFPESYAPLLDTSAQRSKANLGRTRSRARPTRRPHTRSSEMGSLDWRVHDSTDEKEIVSKQRDSDSEEEQPKAKMARSPPTSQRVPVFPGLSPVALLAQIKKRTGGGGAREDGATEEDQRRQEKERQYEEIPPSPSQLSRSPRSPAHLAGAARVLPPIGGTDGGATSSPAWLKELKSKKRLSQHGSQA
uniref:calponin homology domain-containing protein DDB_G0272472-like n=1 Tax=Monopterus albus TaxID=43700 RepID=UPI0009B326FF|nr:calponin homology domain-containing protein DDB_G0272472-like [Monopterus albus]